MPVNGSLCSINEIFSVDQDLTRRRHAGQSADPSKSPAQHLWTSVQQPLIPPPYLFLHWHSYTVPELLDTMNLRRSEKPFCQHWKVFFLFFFFPFWCLWRFSAPNSIGALPSFRLGLHFSALICILREASHWKRSRQSMCGWYWSAARKTVDSIKGGARCLSLPLLISTGQYCDLFCRDRSKL